MRLIDAEKLKKVMENDTFESMGDRIAVLCAIDIAPTVEQKHGHWIFDIRSQVYTCSNCWHITEFGSKKYCSECGSKMDEVTEDE